MNNFSFDLNKSIGRIGEETVANYYKTKGVNIRDVRDYWTYRAKDIDFFFNGCAVEIKTQQHIADSNKITLEVISNTDLKRLKMGWL